MTETNQKHKKETILTTYEQVLKEFQKTRNNTAEETNKQAQLDNKIELETFETLLDNKENIRN